MHPKCEIIFLHYKNVNSYIIGYFSIAPDIVIALKLCDSKVVALNIFASYICIDLLVHCFFCIAPNIVNSEKER